MSKYNSVCATPSSESKKRELSSPLESSDLKKSKTHETHFVLSSEDILAISTALKGTFRDELRSEHEIQVQAIIDGVIAGLESKIHDLQNENENLRKRVVKLELDADNAEQYSRRNCLRISGVSEVGLDLVSEGMKGKPYETDKGDEISSVNGDNEPKPDGKTDGKIDTREATGSKILQLAIAMEANISPTDIDRSHRIDLTKPGKPRDIIVKFTSYRARNNLYRSRFGLKPNGYPGVFVNEDLTRSRSTLFYQARQLFKGRYLLGAWTYDGYIMVKDAGRKIHRVATEADLMKLKSSMPIPFELATAAPKWAVNM